MSSHSHQLLQFVFRNEILILNIGFVYKLRIRAPAGVRCRIMDNVDVSNRLHGRVVKGVDTLATIKLWAHFTATRLRYRFSQRYEATPYGYLATSYRYLATPYGHALRPLNPLQQYLSPYDAEWNPSFLTICIALFGNDRLLFHQAVIGDAFNRRPWIAVPIIIKSSMLCNTP